MSARRRAAGVLLFALLATACQREPIAQQPLAFSHKLHVGEQHVPCTDCHVGAETGVRATLPALSRCLLCHMKPQSSAPDKPPSKLEGEVRALATSGKPVRWVQVTRNPGHVYFSHRPHVGIARMPCADCHGDVTRWAAPPTKPDRSLMSMGACLACHREEGAPTTCITCHQ